MQASGLEQALTSMGPSGRLTSATATGSDGSTSSTGPLESSL